MSTPQVPPRPSRTHQQQPATASGMDPPKIPPRPAHRSIERSRSPNSEHFPRSPLNEPPSFMQHGNASGTLYSNENQNLSSSSLGLPKRPPSVSLPSIGQEGSEYADLDYDKEKLEEPTILDQVKGKSQPEQTRNVGSDLPLHAPRPSFSSSTAKERVAAVTRTDSSSAMAAGIGKAVTPVGSDDKDPHKRPLHPKVSFSSRPDSVASTERPGSAQEGADHGIPDVGIGQRVPMYPDAGDVQAPSPSPYSQHLPSGIGFHNDGSSKSRNQGRRSSAQPFHGPPGSYGMHGHGSVSADNFEKAWYDKHPEALEREEHGQYGPAIGTRPEWALSSEDLNKIVRDTASRGTGFGTSPNVVGLPNEQIGYMATEEYTSRMATPYSAVHNKTFSNHSQTHISSPLRKASFPVDDEGKDGFRSSKRKGGSQSSAEYVLESETDDDAIHVDAPTVRKSKIGGNGYDPPTEDLGPHGGNTEAQGGYIDETGYGVPILASDEVAKEQGTEYLQPAVSPAQERRGSNYYSGMDSDAPPSYQSGLRHGSRPGSAASSRPTSRPGSRPGSVHGLLPGLTRFTSHDDREDLHTPLEDVEEYEPLFPDDDGKDTHSNPAVERFKRREMMKRRFPSQDIWEDTPNSLQLQATVSTPEPTEETAVTGSKQPSATFESPEVEGARKGEATEAERVKMIPREERLAKSSFKPHIRDEMHRPGMIQRFPSRDIWEDSPDSARLETTVDGPQDTDVTSPVEDDGLKAGAVVQTSGRPSEAKLMGNQTREGATAGSAAIEKPTIPPRPTKHKAENADVVTQSPVQLPARPPRRLHQVPPAEIPPPPTKSAETSPTETRKAPTLPDRPKPQVPARPAKTVARDSSESVPLSKTTSATSTGSGGPREEARGLTSPPPAPKPKPSVPARPAGGKIAALKAGFMSDLNKQLQVGPQGPKKEEKPVEEEEKEAEEKAPLADARKGRARGPARRKPVTASTSATREQGESQVDVSKWAIRAPQAIWESENGSIIIISSKAASPQPLTDNIPSPIERPEAPTPTAAATAHGDITGDVPAMEALGEAIPSTEKISANEELHSSHDPSAVKEAEISDLLQDDPQAHKTTLSESETLTSMAPATTAPPDMTSESIQTGTTEVAENAGPEKQEKLTAYLGGEAQKGEDIIVKE
ncbi:MAG: hypothetical protein Q9168_005162 [Polycauliona sp. 1 TL-2023]